MSDATAANMPYSHIKIINSEEKNYLINYDKLFKEFLMLMIVYFIYSKNRYKSLRMIFFFICRQVVQRIEAVIYFRYIQYCLNTDRIFIFSGINAINVNVRGCQKKRRKLVAKQLSVAANN